MAAVAYSDHRGYYKAELLGEVSTKVVLFLLCPFVGWLYSLRSANTRSSMVIFFLFSLLICWHFSPTGYNDHYDDFLGIMDRFEDDNFTTAEIWREIRDFFSFSKDAPKELYEDVLNWFVKSFTNNYHIFFLLAAIPVAFCINKFVKMFVTDTRFTPNLFGIITVFLAILPRDIVTVQNPRFATGFWVCTMCTIMYYCYGKRWRYVLPILCAPIFHSGMWMYVALFFASLFVPKNIKLWRIIALCTIPFMFLDPDLFQNFDFSILPPGIQGWAERYMSDQAYATFILNEGKSGFWWVASIFNFLLRIAYIWMTISLMCNYKTICQDEDARRIYPFYLILFSVVNMIQFVPVLGGRYYWFTRVFCLFIWFKAFYGIKSHMKEIYFLLIPCSWSMINRYGYFLGGALSTNTPIDLFYAPLPYLVGKGWLW